MWTNDSHNDEVYVIDVIRGKLVNTIENESREFVSVQNWARVRETNMHNELLDRLEALENAAATESTATSENGGTTKSAASTESTANKSDDSGNGAATAALVIGILALLVGTANLILLTSFKSQMMKSQSQAVPKQVSEDTNHDVEASSLPSRV